MQTIPEVTELFSSVTEAQRQQTIRALLEQYLKNCLAQQQEHDGP